MATPLPPFGIRNLVSSDEAYNVLQVDEDQYSSAIRSHPSATLMYVDEDDGENVTIGSSLELKQRLEDPPPATAPLIPFYNPSNEQLELQFIHLFDIQRSNASQSVWREHHAYFTKDQQRMALAQNKTSETDVAGEPAVDHLDSSRSSQVRNIQQVPQSLQRQIRENDQSGIRPAVVPSNPVPDLIENLASLLDSTSQTLRRVTERTRETNTSPIEDVLSGVSNIVTEIGNFGMSLLESIENGTVDKNTTANQEAASYPIELVPEMQTPVRENDCHESTLATNPGVTAIAEVSQTSGADAGEDNSSIGSRDGCDFCCTMKLRCRKSTNSTMACTNCVILGRSCMYMPASDGNVSDKESESKAPEELHAAAQEVDSILDQDTEDVDFSRRYPPLMSLRRANTVAGLRGHVNEPEMFKPNVPNLEKHNSCKVRFLRRPFPQVFDAETQRRKDFARQCFPTQRYTPGLGAQKGKPVSPPYWKFRRPLTAAEFYRTDQPSAPQLTTLTGSPELEHDTPSTAQDHIDRTLDSIEPNDSQTVIAGTNEQIIPGAWPKLKSLPSTPQHASSESSGAFFDRMMREGSTSRQNIQGVERVARHPSLVRQKPNTNPFSNLTRSNTVGGPPNPASRLSGPFEPLYPFQAAKSPDPLHALRNSWNRDTTAHQKTLSERPRSLHPYRSFSPVWEDNLDHKRAKLNPATTNDLDHRGESSSMYSPPPRHMQSVPNFASFTANLNSNKSTLSLQSKATPPAPLEKTTEPPLPLFSGHVPVSELQPSTSEAQSVDTAQLELFQSSRTVSPEPFAVPPRPENPLNKALGNCLTALQAMGYGCDDENLKSRLHIYAEAANGDVMEAVEMIEEDKKANFGISVEGQLNERNDAMDWESD